MSAFLLHPAAYADLDEIRAYIAQYSPDAADHVLDEIFEALRSLQPFPHRGIDDRT